MYKRGQLTLFVVLGIVIIVIIGLGLYFGEVFKKSIEEAKLAEREALSQKEKNVANLIDNCVAHTLENAIIVISRNGGYYPAKKGSVPYLSFNIPLYLNKGKENLPTKDDFSLSLENYVDDNIENCLIYIEEEFEVLRSPKSKVTLGNVIKAEVEMLVKVGESRLKKFSGETDVKYEDTFAEVEEFYSIVKKFETTRDIVEMGRHVVDKGYKYSVINQNNVTLYLMMWENYINEKPLIFTFGIKKKFVDKFFSNLTAVSDFEGFDLEELIEEQEESEEEDAEIEEMTEEEALEAIADSQYNETQAEEAGDLLAEL